MTSPAEPTDSAVTPSKIQAARGSAAAGVRRYGWARPGPWPAKPTPARRCGARPRSRQRPPISPVVLWWYSPTFADQAREPLLRRTSITCGRAASNEVTQ